MTTFAENDATETIFDLLHRLGDVPSYRVRLHPTPGTATEQDVISIEAHEDRLFELVDGVLVEKAMGCRESILAMAIGSNLSGWVTPRNLGLVSGADGFMRLFAKQVRIPDVAFVSWARLTDGQIPSAPIPDLAPDLAVEVLSESNTKAEMGRKRREYFAAGARLVWEFDPDLRTVDVYSSPESKTTLASTDILDGGTVLPGFTLSLAELFARLDGMKK